VWLGDVAIPGSAEAVAALRDAGHSVAFCTNNSSATRADYESKLAGVGIPAHGAVLSSAMAVGSLLRTDERVLVCAGAGAREAVLDAGALEVGGGDATIDTVLVGFHTTFDYAEMTTAVRAVLGGARLLATNDDPIYPGADGPAPGCGAILASIERATGRRAVIAGKPYGAMGDLVHQRCGPTGVFVGDSLDTDAAMAAVLGWPFALVLSGNTPSAPDDDSIEWVANDLGELVRHALTEP
jgi:HAD superfamily hydrolase (TIGR01450 family)